MVQSLPDSGNFIFLISSVYQQELYQADSSSCQTQDELATGQEANSVGKIGLPPPINAILVTHKNPSRCQAHPSSSITSVELRDPSVCQKPLDSRMILRLILRQRVGVLFKDKRNTPKGK